MKFTVLLDNFNYAAYLGQAIESALGQTCGDFELVIVDDGSTDASREIINGYRDPRIIPVFKENGGQASAFVSGFAKASGEYIAFLDADDLWDSNKLERCAVALAAEPDVVLLNHGSRVIDEKGLPSGHPDYLPAPGLFDLRGALRATSGGLALASTSFMVGRRRECLALQINPGQWRIAADAPVIAGLGMRGKIFNLSEPLGSYRVHGANLFFERRGGALGTGAGLRGSDSQAGENPIFAHFEHFQRFYQLASEENARLGNPERYDFLNTDFAIGIKVAGTRRFSPEGLRWRFKKWARDLKNLRR